MSGYQPEDVFVAGGKIGIGELHLAEPVVLVRVGPGDPENEIG